ncbi:HNH endonuclease [Pseudacidovorax sp. NFM-22]|uniref:HNH endonuclease n=1 Tax=Pseudacidovorax sp. NFM-22 TaxID=2744469 RepID=UPI001F227750|nr:HNH endonuclease [Pseudacidovorax sp. NFM-22]
MNVYLAGLDEALGSVLLSLIARDNEDIPRAVEDAAAEQAIAHSAIPETTKQQLINARKGQGLFRSRVSAISPHCRVTGTADPRVLVASHIKPWSKSSDKERLDGNNGLLLAPHVDRLFDRFWISFGDDGQLLTAGPAVAILLRNWGIEPNLRSGPFTRRQSKYMTYHRGRLAEVTARGLWT